MCIDDIIIIPPLHALLFLNTKMYIEVDIGCIVNTFWHEEYT